MLTKEQEEYVRPKGLKYNLYRLFFRKEAKAAERMRRAEVQHKKQLNPATHDFSYESGERQTATDLSGIRRDHVMRYEWAAGRITEVLGNSGLRGGDYFCGNGYGTNILAPFGQVTGIDGSQGAIDVAKTHYSSAGAEFRCELFPFELEPASHDFIISLESVEHVPEPEAFVEALAKGMKPGGLLVLSTPNEKNYPFDPVVVPHHVRHFHIHEVVDLCVGFGFELDQMVGQSKAVRNANEYELCEPEDGRFVVFSFRKK